MDVISFNTKVDLKILQLTFQYNKDISDKGVSCVWKDIYILSEAVKVVNDELTGTDCITKIISALDCKYQLADLERTDIVGISEMSIDPLVDCNVFTVYE